MQEDEKEKILVPEEYKEERKRMAAVGSKEMKLLSKVKHRRALIIADKEAMFNMEN